ncbi:spore cortex-lytic enzyme [Ferviditalea candida]|uniref:Spore cortex-lytic enzyme n=1 Tax=Ferviditalea candida TaxID=3108399 RepID=A0ABU5ZCK7_9BACL|nr:spore cortex-lytic enzyme [Paenibacillaceae bacterium T2]
MPLELGTAPDTAYSFGKQILKVGSRGGDVYELQGRLAYLGFYTGKIDGQFGWRTYKAVRYFQWKFGMRVDGVVGSKTKLMLWKATKNWRPGASGGQAKSASTARTSSYGSNDVKLLARAVFGEARGEPYIGQVAVAAVILNRVQNPKFPKTIAGVIFQPGAFTAVSDGQIWLNPDSEAFRAARDALNGWDPSGNALYYFNPNTATSGWIWSRPQIKRIGDHIFTK